jgi:hypothetical protein
VESVRPDGSIVTIEGNTDERVGRTGGEVMRKVRRVGIVGYSIPDYSNGAPVWPKSPAWPSQLLKDGSSGPNVKLVQSRLLHSRSAAWPWTASSDP